MPEPVLNEDEALAFLAYLTSSAELALTEPDLYGSFRLADAASILTAAATLGLCGTLLAHAGHSRTVYWFSGWRPHRGIALGISFTVDQFGAAMATMVAGLTLCAFVYSWHYFEETVEHGFNVLMLVFMAAMVGFSFTGDLFNLFVWFELMGTAAYALTGYKLEARSPLQGALNFGVSNSMGGYTILLGIALLYARTGALNLAQIGHAVEGRTPDGLLIGAFVLIVVGLFVKAAVVPFHFWLADAHAVAPTPVCVLFSGAMVELGLFGAARLYWTVFHGPFAARAPDLGHMMIGLGALTEPFMTAAALYPGRTAERVEFSPVEAVFAKLAEVVESPSMSRTVRRLEEPGSVDYSTPE